MINLRPNTILAKWFVWCCDHLLGTVTREYARPGGIRRTGAYYLEHGTTLCHIFWATVWVPLMSAAAITIVIALFLAIHIDLYLRYSSQFGIASALLPEGVALGVGILVVIVMFAIMGVYQVGFFKLLWLFLKGIKNKVCPRVTFAPTDK
jgi:hypothetical protein